MQLIVEDVALMADEGVMLALLTQRASPQLTIKSQASGRCAYFQKRFYS